MKVDIPRSKVSPSPLRRDSFFYGGLISTAGLLGGFVFTKGAIIGFVTFVSVEAFEGTSAAALILLSYGAIAFGVLVAALGLLMSPEAPCPACGEKISGLSLGDNPATRCDACKIYVHGRTGEIEAVPDDLVTSEPTFAASLPAGWSTREGCALCNGERVTSVVHEWVSRVGSEKFERSVKVPLCAEHAEGVVLRDGKDAVFTRYAQYRAYLAPPAADAPDAPENS